MIERWGVVVKASKDKGPFMLVTVKSEMRTFTAKVHNPSGMVGSPRVGSLVTVHANPDGGMERVTPHELSADRNEGHKEGEVSLGNTKTKTKIYLNDAGEAVIESETDVILLPKGKTWIGGKGGKAVARVGDKTTDGAAITEGSSKVFAVD